MAGRVPPNFKTDVHRNPTKKWAAAPSYSYAGDDWGGYDEFDEYGSYDDPPQAAKPTGLRPRGQALPAVDTALASTSTAAPQSARRGSFEYGDERRTFSAGTRPPEQRYSPTKTEDYAKKPVHGLRKPSQDVNSSPVNAYAPIQPGEITTGLSTSQQLGTSNRQPSPIKHDTTTSDLPSPIQSSAVSPHQLPPISNVPESPYSQSNFTPPPRKSSVSANGQPAAHFPIRKSSLRQLRTTDNSPPKAVPLPASTTVAQDMVGATPVSGADSAAQNTQSAPRFVRPSDIYKRLESELEKERQSIDSGRPGIDSINRAGAEAAPTTSASNSGYLNAPLSTVPERKSEYGLDGFTVTNPVLAQAIGASVSPTHSDAPPSFSLPQLGRMSSFGDDFMGSSSTNTDTPQQSQPYTQASNTSNYAATNRGIVSDDASIERQPSKGLRSAVEYAFDPQEDPSSARDDSQSSMLGSDLSRDSSTRDMSPIMSTVPSTASGMPLGQNRHRIPPEESAIPEEPREARIPDTRPTSSTTLRGAATTMTGQGRGASPDSTTSIPQGYRRDMNPPNRENSPARKLEIHTEQHLPQGASGEMDLTTPSSKYSSSTAGSGPVDTGSAGGWRQAYARNASQGDSPAAIASGSSESPISVIRSKTPLSDSQVKTLPHSRTSSPGKNRVRDLANRYDENHSRSHSPANSISSSTGRQRRQDTGGSFSSNAGSERGPGGHVSGSDSASLGLPRPQLPGSWVSYANSERSMTPDGSREDEQTISTAHTPRLTDAIGGAVTPRAESEVPDFSPSSNRRSASGSGMSDNPLAALQAAGSAMGASLMSSVGLRTDADESDPEGTDSYAPSEDDRTPEAAPRTFGHLHPRPLGPDQSVMSPGSSIAPAPPAKDMPMEMNASGRDTDYFPVVAPAPLKQRGMMSTDTDEMRGDAPLLTQPTSSSSSSRRNMSLESSPEDTYNDRLRKDIARSLNTPINQIDEQPSSIKTTNLAPVSTLAPPSPRLDATRESTQSTMLPREYDSYWASTDNSTASRETSSNSLLSSQHPASSAVPLVDPSNIVEPETRQAAPPKPSLGRHRYSWEAEDEDEEDEEEETPGPVQISTVTQGTAAPATFPTSSTGITSSLKQPEQESIVRDAAPPSQDLHHISTADFRNVDPTPASATSYKVPKIDFGDDENLRSSLEQMRVSQDEVPSNTTRNIAGLAVSDGYVSSVAQQKSTDNTAVADLPVKRDASQFHNSSSGPQPKLVAFRDIMSMDSYNARLDTYNQTRNEFAGMDNGLGSWLSYMVAAHPEHAEAVAANVKPMVDSGFASSVRSKLAPGMSKISRSNPAAATSQPYYMQYLDSAGDLPATSTAQLSSSPSQREPSQSRTTSGQHKSKDLLHSAGVFGGKATSSAKGLFAKGKSRFNKGGSEKAVD